MLDPTSFLSAKDRLRSITPAPLWRAAAFFKRAVARDLGKRSYSSHGEDLLCAAWLHRALDFRDIRYVDVGAAHPTQLSNTYFFYRRGATGVLIEPDPRHTKLLRRRRSRDTIINAGVAFDARRSAKLFRMSFPVFNTFSAAQAARCVELSQTWEPHERQAIIDQIEVPLIPINDVITNSMKGARPHFVSIDAETVDIDILRTLDLDLLAPRSIICIERCSDLAEIDPVLHPGHFRLFAETPDNFLFMRGH